MGYMIRQAGEIRNAAQCRAGIVIASGCYYGYHLSYYFSDLSKNGDDALPVISMFYGIIISMYFREHQPPHFHAEYQGQNAVFSLDGSLLEGDFPANKTRMVMVWAEIHREELIANWQLATEMRGFFKIEPLR